MSAQPPTPKAPDETTLREAALTHLARYATTRANLTRVLDRRIDRWARATSADPDTIRSARQAARNVVASLAAIGAVDDASFAANRTRSLTRAGRSRRAIAAHLAARGITDTAAPENPETELAAALACTRRRRIGPFRTAAPTPEIRLRELGVLARAGFARDIAIRALDTAAAEAERLITWLKNG